MGSYIEINDTLQISKAQGFPEKLNIDKHLETPYSSEMFNMEIFNFHNKQEIRLFQQPPVRNFLVENINGKWIYWGLIHILSVSHDYTNKTTSGTFKIIYINTPQEMKDAHHLIDQNPSSNYFA